MNNLHLEGWQYQMSKKKLIFVSQNPPFDKQILSLEEKHVFSTALCD
jgi:hypothetical protein